jgi:hypothetical protein
MISLLIVRLYLYCFGDVDMICFSTIFLVKNTKLLKMLFLVFFNKLFLRSELATWYI